MTEVQNCALPIFLDIQKDKVKAYLDIVKKILDKGIEKKDRTGVGTIAISGVMFEHNMSEGFPLLTTKSVPLRLEIGRASGRERG